MKQLNKNVLLALNSSEHLELPDFDQFELPEKILQFGTGVLLRGLPDQYIQEANNRGVFNGRIVVVKSTAKGDVSEFDEQDNLYTVCTRGIENGKLIDRFTLNATISRVINAATHWQEVSTFQISVITNHYFQYNRGWYDLPGRIHYRSYPCFLSWQIASGASY